MTRGGKREGAGRKKGSKGKVSQDVADRLDALGCDPIEGMALIAERALKVGDDDLAGKMYKELIQYIAPKRKAVEHSGKIDGEHSHDHKFEIVFVDPPERD